MTSAVLRSAQAGAFLTALGLSAGLLTGVAQAEPPDVAKQFCPSPFFGDGLNARYGVKQRIVGPPDCRVAYVGEKWVRAVPPWVTAGVAEQQAFITNFKGARYVIDANPDGTGGQTVTAGKEILVSGNVDPNSPVLPNRPFAVPVSPVFDHLSVGTHTINVFVTMTGPVCNGLKEAGLPPNAPGLSTNCLPGSPGGVESVYPVSDFGGGNAQVGLKFNVVLPPTPTSPAPGG